MPGDMSGPLNYKLDGTTPKAQVTNTYIPAGERRNKMPIFISRVHDAQTFLVWLQASCPVSLINKYAALSQRKAGTVDNNWEDTNAEEIQAYIGILTYMGLVDLPEIEDYKAISTSVL